MEEQKIAMVDYESITSAGTSFSEDNYYIYEFSYGANSFKIVLIMAKLTFKLIRMLF